MADSLSTIGSIANFLATSYPDLPQGLSGNLVIIADLARSYVETYTGQSIGSNSISDRYQSAILDFARADMVDMLNSQIGGTSISLGDLSVTEQGGLLSSSEYRQLGEMKLKSLGGNIQYAQSLSY